MRDRVHHDVREVVVDQAVDDLTPVALAADHAGGLEHSQVLADEGLGDAEAVHQLVHAQLGAHEFEHDRDPDRCGERAQQVARGDQYLGVGLAGRLAIGVDGALGDDVRRDVGGNEGHLLLSRIIFICRVGYVKPGRGTVPSRRPDRGER